MTNRDLESIADQNDPHGNIGSRGRAGGSKRKGRSPWDANKGKPKWKNQLRGIKSARRRS